MFCWLKNLWLPFNSETKGETLVPPWFPPVVSFFLLKSAWNWRKEMWLIWFYAWSVSGNHVTDHKQHIEQTSVDILIEDSLTSDIEMIVLDTDHVSGAADDFLGIRRKMVRMPGSRLVRIQPSYWHPSCHCCSSKTDNYLSNENAAPPWVFMAADECRKVGHSHGSLFCCVPGRGAAAGLRGPGSSSGCGGTDPERRTGEPQCASVGQ